MSSLCEKSYSSGLVSVVIPVSNRVFELKRALSSVLSQTYKNIEVVVVCNNTSSPDKVKEACECFSDSRVYYYYLDQCKNANVARNYGVYSSSGIFVAFLDSDDEWEPVHIENSVKLINNNCCDFIFGAAKVNDGFGLFVKKSRDLKVNENPVDFLLGFKRGYAQTSSYLVKRECFNHVEWDEDLHRHQDYDFFIKISKKFKVKCNKDPDVIIHWKRGEKREYDHRSVEIFLSRYKRDMSITTRVRYHLMMMYVSFLNRSVKSFFYFVLSLLKNNRVL